MEQLVIAQRIIKMRSDITIMTLEGVLDINTVESFGTIFGELFKKRHYKIVLNMQKVTYLSSAGIGLLVATIKVVRGKKGDVKLSNIPPDIYKVFELVELPGMIQMFRTEEDAIASF